MIIVSIDSVFFCPFVYCCCCSFCCSYNYEERLKELIIFFFCLYPQRMKFFYSTMQSQKIVFFTAFLFLFLTLYAKSADGASATAVLLDLLPIDTSSKTYWEPYREGLYCLLKHVYNFKILNTVITMIDGSTLGGGTNIQQILSAAQSQYPNLLAVIGPYSDSSLHEAVSLISNVTNYTFLGPLTGGLQYRGFFNPNIFFGQGTPKGELLVLLKYAVTAINSKRIGFIYTTGVSCGEDLYQAAVQYLSNVGRSSSTLVTYSERDSSSMSSSALTNVISKAPQAILIQGKPGKHLQNVLEALFSSSSIGSSSTILAGSYQQVLVMNEYSNSKSTKANVVLSSPTAPMTATKLIGSFQTNMAAYNAASSNSWKADKNIASENYAIGNLMYEGYLLGGMIAFAVRQTEFIQSPSKFINGLFTGYTQFILETNTVGYYGGYCSPMLKEQGAICSCNEGGQTMWVLKYSSSDPTKKAIGTDVFSKTNDHVTCGIEGDLPTVVNVYRLKYSKNDVLSYAFEEFQKVQQSPPNPLPGFRIGLKNQYMVVTNSAEGGENLDALNIDVVSGPFDPSTTELVPRTALWSPVYPQPMVNTYVYDEYHLTPVIAQDVLVLYSALTVGSIAPPILSKYYKTVTGVIKGATAEQTHYLQEAFVTLAPLFDIDAAVESVGAKEDITTKMWNVGINALVGMTASDFDNVASNIFSNMGFINCAVYIPYRTMSLFFSDELSIKNSDRKRVWTDSNIDYLNSSPTQGPLEMESLLAVNLLANNYDVFHGGPLNTKFEPMKAYGVLTATDKALVDGEKKPVAVKFYPPEITDSLTSKVNYRGRNYGATTVTIYSMDNQGGSYPVIYSMNPEASLFTSFTPATTTTSTTSTTTIAPTTTTTTTTLAPSTSPRPKEEFNTRLLIALLLWLVCLLLLWALLAFVCFVCCTMVCVGGGAPTSSEKPITLMNTHVDFSASLWSELPELQEVAIEQHERLVRDLIKKYKCYEVMSDGSGFVIASKKPFPMVQLAVEIQQTLLQHDWNTEKIDDWYIAMEKKLGAENNSNYTPSLTPEEYKTLWSGLRVRSAIHTGYCGVRQHPSKRYSYYGRTVQTTAEIESLAYGGQCLVTELTWDQLTPEEISSLDHTYIGPHLVHGEDQPISLYMINAVPGRVFGPLRRPPEHVTKDYQKDEKLSPLAQFYASVIRQSYSKEVDDQREGELISYAQQWDVIIPPKQDLSDEQYNNLLISLIAKKMVEDNTGSENDSGSIVDHESNGNRDTFSVTHTIIVPKDRRQWKGSS